MAQLLLTDIDVETAEKLERRAKRLGTTPEEEAARLLRDRLRAEPSGELRVTGADEASPDPRFERQHGVLVFTGMVATGDVPDQEAAGAAAILTFNERDFVRLSVNESPSVVVPPDPPAVTL